MTYANAVLPHSLFVAAERWPDGPFMNVAEQTFGFLVRETTTNGLFWPVGNCGLPGPNIKPCSQPTSSALLYACFMVIRLHLNRGPARGWPQRRIPGHCAHALRACEAIRVVKVAVVCCGALRARLLEKG